MRKARQNATPRSLWDRDPGRCVRKCKSVPLRFQGGFRLGDGGTDQLRRVCQGVFGLLPDCCRQEARRCFQIASK
eukprot:4618781-Alexandrium_andersonii.AAC.1